MKGLDYSNAHPGLDCIVSQGYSFVGRYIGGSPTLKNLDATELAEIRRRNLSVGVFRETTQGFMYTDDGRVHAETCARLLHDLGMDDAIVFYALDVDYRGLIPSQLRAVDRFLQDAASITGGHRVGIYGSDDAIDHWVGLPYCQWGWQTYAWSNGRISPNAHLRQYRNGVSLCGGLVDLNETYVDDFGQWPRPVQPPIDLEGEDMLVLLYAPSNDTFWLVDTRSKLAAVIPKEDFDKLKATNDPDIRIWTQFSAGFVDSLLTQCDISET